VTAFNGDASTVGFVIVLCNLRLKGNLLLRLNVIILFGAVMYGDACTSVLSGHTVLL